MFVIIRYLTIWIISFSFLILEIPLSEAKSKQLPPFLANGINFDWWVRREEKPLLPQYHILSSIHAAGFTHIRYPLNPSWLVRYINDDHNINCSNEVSIFITNLIDVLKRTNLGLVLVLDATNDEKSEKWLKEESARLAAVVTCLGTAAEAADPQFARNMIAIGLLNEPRGNPQRWWNTQRDALSIARLALPHVWLLAQATYPSSITSILREQPISVDRIIYDVHFYEPFIFTHQGVRSAPDWLSTISGLPFRQPSPLNPCLAKVTVDGIANCFSCRDGFENLFCNKFKIEALKFAFTVEHIERELLKLVAWANGRPVYISEYGTNRGNSNRPGAPPEDRIAWLKHVASLAKQYGFGRAVYALGCGFGVTTDFACSSKALDQEIVFDAEVTNVLR
ncbi:glycoside hydrolase family 5 protein [Methylobacterium hispanicum]|uniref:glycoside hydrolase family 5 protein n=1 Tax=Methylobacterium hispanicum TaxID=270350 RepID=UPI002F34C5E4